MKVSELLNIGTVGIGLPLEEQLKNLDWHYDISIDNDRRFRKGAIAMEQIEAALYTLWKDKPEKALALWEQYCPWGDTGSAPDFIWRKASRDKTK